MEVANGRFRRPTALEKARQCTWLFEMQARGVAGNSCSHQRVAAG